MRYEIYLEMCFQWLLVLQLHITFKGSNPVCGRSWKSLNCTVVMEWRPSDLPVWRWPAAHSSFPVAGWPCSPGYCSRRRWARGRALWWVAGGWNTGTAADTVSATRWAGGQTAQSPGTHTVTAHTHTQPVRPQPAVNQPAPHCPSHT